MKAIGTSTFLGVAMILAITYSGPKAAASVESGVAAYDQGDFATAIKEWQTEAAKGDRNALFNLGQVYRLGKGVPKDIDRAEEYYLQAAKLGHPAAQGNLGTLYYFGKGGAKSQPEKALKWWRLAARNNDPRSQYMLGVLYFNGTLVARDMVTAYGWMNLAAQSHLKEALDAERMMISFLKPDEIEAGKKLSPTLIKPAGDDVADATALAAASGGPTVAGAAAAKAAGTPLKPAALPTVSLTKAEAEQMAARNSAPPPAATVNTAPVAPSSGAVSPTPASTAPASTAPASTAPVSTAPVSTAPVSPAPVSATPAAGDAAFRAQLGAYKSRDMALTAWQQLQATHRQALGDMSPLVAEVDLGGAKGVFYRLQTGTFATSREALDFCRNIKAVKVAKAGRVDCMIVKVAAK